LVNFLLEDSEIIDLLIKKFKEGVRIYIITSLEKNLEKYKEVWKSKKEKYDETLNDDEITEKFKNHEKLCRNGIAIRGHNKCHAKFCIIDDKHFIVSSANLSFKSLNENPELGIIGINSLEMALFLSKLFIFLYDKICTYTSTHRENEIKEEEPYNIFDKCQISLLENLSNNQPIWTIDVNESKKILDINLRLPLYNKIMKLISEVKEEIIIFSYLIKFAHNEENNQNLWDAIFTKIKNENIKLKIILRNSKIKPIKKYIEKQGNYLIKNVDIYGHKSIHAHGIIFDNSTCIFGSANISSEFGLKNNIELGWILERTKNEENFKKILNFVQKIEKEAKKIELKLD